MCTSASREIIVAGEIWRNWLEGPAYGFSSYLLCKIIRSRRV